MAIRCPRCGREYDVTLFSFGATVRCECGAVVSALEPHRAPGPETPGASPVPDLADPRARRGVEEIARGADRIADMILAGDWPDVDVEIAIARLRDQAEELFPGRGWFFDLVYEARFRRLREQWGSHRRGEGRQRRGG